MNQILTIRNLNAWMKGENSIINMTRDGFYTPDWMIEKGIYSCHTCGHLNSIESERCAGCNDEKFILRASYAKFKYRKQETKRNTYFKII